MRRGGIGLALWRVVAIGCLARGYKVPVSRGTTRVEITADAARPGCLPGHAWEFMTGSCNPSLYLRPVWKDKMLGHLAYSRPRAWCS